MPNGVITDEMLAEFGRKKPPVALTAVATIAEPIDVTLPPLRKIIYPTPTGEWTREPDPLAGPPGVDTWSMLKVFGEGLTLVPEQWGAAIIKAIIGEGRTITPPRTTAYPTPTGEIREAWEWEKPYLTKEDLLRMGRGGPSVVDPDWADILVEKAHKRQEEFILESLETYGDKITPELAAFPGNLAYSLTSMGFGLLAAAPVLPFSRAGAWATGTAVSGVVAYRMTAYEIVLQYLKLKDAEMMAEKGRGLTLEEENQLKDEFHSLAHKYALWEAIPEAISNLAFVGILTAPLTKMLGKELATQIITKIALLFGEELLTETITQKGQSEIEVIAGLREERITVGEAFKEIAFQTCLLTIVMGGAGQAIISSANAMKKLQNSLKTEIGETHPLYDEFLDAAKSKYTDLVTPEVAPPAEPVVTPPVAEAVPTAPEVLIPPRAVEEVAVELERVTAEVEGITEYLATEPARKLINVIKKTGWQKGEISNLTLKQYRDITGKTTISPAILTADKKHIRWEYSLDEIATEMGYESGDVLREAIIATSEANTRLKALKNEKARLTAEIKEVEAPVIGIQLPKELPTQPPPLAPVGVALGRTSSEFTGIAIVDLQDAQTVSDIAFRNDMVRQWVTLLPEIHGLIRILNPSAVANTPAMRSIIVRATLRDEGRQKAQGVIAYLNELGTQEKVFGKVADDGTIASGKLKGVHPNDIRTYPNRYAERLTDEQNRWIERADDIEKAKLDFLTRNGIEINELGFEEGGRYAGRRVYAKVIEGEVLDTAYVGAGPGRPGARLAAEKFRFFKNIDEATQAGYRYLPEDEALYLNIQGAYNRVADKQMADWLLTQVPWRTTGAPEELILAAEQARLKYRHSQLLSAALNRAVRGERVPDVTINSIARSYPDQAQELKDLIPMLQEGAPTAKRVQNLTRVAKGLVNTNKLASQRAVNARARARERAMITKREEAIIPAPAFAGKILTGKEARETAQILRKAFDPGFSKALQQVNKANAIGRYFMLAGDISPMTIQLIFLTGQSPVLYGKAFGGLSQAIFNPRFHSQYLTKHKDTIDKHPNLLLTKAGATEFTEAMARGGWLSGKQTLLPKAESYWKSLGLIIPRTLGKVGGTVLSPFQRGFEAALDIAGIELAEAYDYMCTTPERTADVDQFINEFRGVTSSARIGVPSFQQQIETGSVLAPRYNRAIAALLFDLGRGGIRGSLARQSLAKGIAALSVLSVIISIARGEDKDEILDHFNPNSANFFTWDVAGQKIGPGSKVRSVVKLFAQSVSNPEALFQLSMDNPAFRFVRGNLSPVVGAGIDLITGRSYIGDPTRDGMMSFSKEILGGNLLPIWVQSVLLEGGDLKGRTARGIAEFFGGRGYPEPLWGEVGKLRDKYAKMDFNVKYEELNRAQIDELRHNHPDLVDLEEKARLDAAERGTEFEKWLFETREQIIKERNDALEKAASALLNDLMSKRDYDSERKYARPYYSGGMAVLWSARESLDPYAVRQIEKWMGENQKPEDKALDKYLEYRGNLIAKADLPKDWDKIEAQSEAYLSQFSRGTQEYIRANRNRWIESLPPNAQQVERMRLSGIEDESWWTNYRGTAKPTPTEPSGLITDEMLEEFGR